MDNLERQKEFRVKTNSYTIKFPTVGQFLDIESRRMQLSNGSYSMLLRSALISSGTAMDMIDMAATLSVLCPDLIKDIKAPSLMDLDPFDANELLTAYNTDIKSWIDKWMGVFINAVNKDKKEDGAGANT